MRHDKRYVVEGMWSGYRSSQTRICHRTVTRYPEWFKVHTIRFTDGTTLDITVRPCLLREKIKTIDGYSDLIQEANTFDRERGSGYVTVDELNTPKETMLAAREGKGR